MRKYGTILAVSLIIVLLDQITKYLAETKLELYQSVKVIPSIFHITLHHNTGAGFSILQGQQFLLIGISIIVVGIIVYYTKKIKENQTHLIAITGMVLGGTIGNLIDRIRLGYVVDFFDFQVWPVFNIADSFLTIGVIYLIWYFWKYDTAS